MADWLDKLRKAGEKATDAPWKACEGDISTGEGVDAHSLHDDFFYNESDADFAALARNVWAEAVAVIEAAERIIPALDAVEVVSERDRAALINALIRLRERVEAR